MKKESKRNLKEIHQQKFDEFQAKVYLKQKIQEEVETAKYQHERQKAIKAMEVSRHKEAESLLKKKEIKQRDEAIRKLEFIESIIMKKLQQHLMVQKDMIEEIESGRFKERHSESFFKLNPSMSESLNQMPSITDHLNSIALHSIEEKAAKRTLRRRAKRGGLTNQASTSSVAVSP